MVMIVTNKENTLKLAPPGNHKRLAEHHWIQHYDGDGRRTSVSILQWQPGVQAWCHSNQIATGQEIHLDFEMNDWIGVCPMPDLENDQRIFATLQKRARQARVQQMHGKPFTEEHLETIRQLLIMHSDVV